MTGWLVALAGWACAGGLGAAEERPAILVPRAEPVRAAKNAPEPRAARAPVSERLRGVMNERLAELAAALPMEKEEPEGEAAKAGATLSAEGAVVMSRFVVRSVGPSEREVEPGNLLLGPLRRFERMEPIGRKVTGFEATLLRWADGAAELNLNVINGAGHGMDHGRDFTRSEIALRIRF